MHDLWFEDFKDNNTSQHGEDGIIAKIFSIIGTTNKFVVECGASDGVKNSNAHTLVKKDGWGALLIEGDTTTSEILKKNYKDYPKATCVESFISFEGEKSFDGLFKIYNVPRTLDLLILDIDGNEYHVWESLKEYRPRVIMVEFNQTIPNDVDFIQPKDMSIQQGSSLKSLRDLGENLSYRLVAVTDINAFFVANEDAGSFGELNNTLEVLRPRNPYETKIFQLYDGTLKIVGNKKLLWHKIDIEEEKIQVLPKNRRIYLNGINSNERVRKIKHWARKSSFYPVILKIRTIPFFRNIMR